MKVLMVITSHDQLGKTGRKTGFWLEELAAPYYVFKDSGAEVTLASPKGGRPPLDPKSNERENRTELTLRFESDEEAEAQLDTTVRLDSVKQEDFDTVFYPGGHGPMWDLADDKDSINLIESFLAAGKSIGIVCHSTAAQRHVRTPDGKLLVEGKEVTGFTNGEGRTGRPDRHRAVPRRGRDVEARRHFFKEGKLGTSRGRRRPADHGTEPAFVRSCRKHPARRREATGQAGRQGFVDRGASSDVINSSLERRFDGRSITAETR